MNYSELKAAVAATIKQNGNQEITGNVLQNTLLSIITSVGANSTFAGIATINTIPGEPDQNVFYIITDPGTYPQFGNYVMTVPGIAIAKGSGTTWDVSLVSTDMWGYPSGSSSRTQVAEQLAAIIDLNIYTNDPEVLKGRYAVQNFWLNVGETGNKSSILRIVTESGNSWVRWMDWLGQPGSEYTPTTQVEKITVQVDANTYFEFVVDWSKVTENVQYLSFLEIKRQHVHLLSKEKQSFKWIRNADPEILAAITYGYVNAESYQQIENIYDLRYMWKNYGNNQISLVRFGGIVNGVDTDNYASLQHSGGIAPDLKEVLNLKEITISIDWSKITNGKAWSGSLRFLDRYTFTSANTNDQSTDGYSIKDTTPNMNNVLAVDSLGTTPYQSIAAAIAAVINPTHQNQYEIIVYPGTYNENNLIVPAWTHIHGLTPNSVVVTSKNFEGQTTLPVFDQQNGSSKLSNMTIESYTGYCIHYDVGLAQKTLYNENLVLRKVTGSIPSIIGGGSFTLGTLFHWHNCIFEGVNDAGQVACHTNGNAYAENVHLKFSNCKLINAYLSIGSVGGFGNCVAEVTGCRFQKGKVGMNSWNSPIRNVDLPQTYFANTTEWQLIGGNNENFAPQISSNGQSVQIEATGAIAGQKITVSGSAVDVLFGLVKYQSGGARIKASATGAYMVKDERAGMDGYSDRTDVFQMWKRLGDCSITPKTLTVQIDGGTAMTYNFTQNYLSSQPLEATIIAAVNAVLTGCVMKKVTILTSWDNINTSEKVFVTCTDPNDVLYNTWVTEDGKTCTDTTPANEVYGVAVSEAVNGQVLQVWTGTAYYNGYPNGEYGVGTNGLLTTTAPIKLGVVKDGVFNRY